jgi:DNA polymerase bacteriophage-type
VNPELTALFAKWGSPHAVVANSLRSLICAAPGHRLMAADYSNIEGRALAWLAGEHWKLKAFREFDAGRGADLYKVAYSRAFGVPVDQVDDDIMRQIGKVQELALGYAGSIGAFLSMGANYNVDLAKIAFIAQNAVDPDEWQAACDRYDRIQYDPDAEEDTAAEDENDNPDFAFLEPFKGDPRRGLPREQWAAIRCIVQGWRMAHPATVAFWKSLEAAAIAAVDAKGSVFEAGPVSFIASRTALRCRLPSGRHLTYPFARVVRGVSRKGGKPQTVLLYMAAKGASRTWRPTRAYGGLLAENVTQAVARDLLADALLLLEARLRDRHARARRNCCRNA